MTHDPEAIWRSALQALDEGDVSVEVERALLEAARRIKRRRKIHRRHEANKLRDALRAQTGRVRNSEGAVQEEGVEASRELPNHAHCYVCKRPYKTLHPFYHLLCLDCGAKSYERRAFTPRLDGRRAILTGGRTKIGFRAALNLLRAGARVTITTRYPNDAARRYAAEPDYETFAPRLRVERVDFRDVRAVHTFIDAELRRGEPLDVLINQAAQTIRSSTELERLELTRDQRLAALPAADPPTLQAHAITASQACEDLLKMAGGAIVRDRDNGEWADVSSKNSWDLSLEDVSIAEFFEVQLVNVFAPWALSARLQPLLRASPFADRYIVQVSAVEGRFDGPAKRGTHPHTNMAKAALHMLVRTSAEPLARAGVFMNAVDPGWVSDQSAILKRRPNQTTEASFCPPLDTIDGAARVLDPIARGLTGERLYGQLLKDFASISW